ncbi:MAG: AMP-binding protein [Pseudomonadota bacterium]
MLEGDSSSPLWHKTIPQIFNETVLNYRHHMAAYFMESNICWSYCEMADIVDEIAAGLLALGLQKGECIAIWSPNRWEWVALQFASARIGLILVNINPAYQLVELKYALVKIGIKALVLAENFKTSNYIAMVQTLIPELEHTNKYKIESSTFPCLKFCIRMGTQKTPGMINVDDVIKLSGPAQRLRLDSITSTLKPDDPINIQFTSGTTGQPKGATLTHKNIINNARFVVDRLHMSANDKLCIPVPLYHCFGMVMGSLGCVTKGACMVFPSSAFDPVLTMEALDKMRCTSIYGVPTMFVHMLDHPDFKKYNLTNLRTGIMAGAPCPIEIMKRVIEQMHLKGITIAYGMTETSPVSFQSHIDDTIERRVATVGRIHPHVNVKIIDENNHIVPVGQQGELCTKGYSVMCGYWGDDEQTKASIDNEGWMHTGDLAKIDTDGYCTIIGRVKDMIIRGGENIYPREIEDFLFQHRDIQQVQVFGVDDNKFGEEICAWIVPMPDTHLNEQNIRDFCKGQIAHYKIPRYIRFKKTLPMTVTGKPQKFIMRKQMVDELQGRNKDVNDIQQANI